ncbi:MAG: ABC transporter ATP-binding protein [Paracoccaceae bacterium]
MKAENLTVKLSRGTVLHDISFELAKGELLTLVGPNGAGKSTLLRTLSRLIPYRGTLEFPDTSSAHHIAYVPQRPELPVGMSVAEYVLLGRNKHISWFAKESAQDRAIVEATIRDLDLTDLAQHPVDELSGGEVQRAVLARALAQQASMLILDEPTSALDLGFQVQVMRQIKQLRKKYPLTIIMALHDLTMAAHYSDKVMLLKEGRNIATGTPQEVFTEQRLSQLYNTPINVAQDQETNLLIAPKICA